jgi:hypothetical protein
MKMAVEVAACFSTVRSAVEKSDFPFSHYFPIEAPPSPLSFRPDRSAVVLPGTVVCEQEPFCSLERASMNGSSYSSQ